MLILYGCRWHLCVLSVALASCHFSGSLKTGMATTFLVHLCTPVLNISALKDVSKTNFNFKARSQNCENRLLMSVRPHGTTWLPVYEFSWNSYLSIFRKSVDKIQVSSKSDKNNGYFTWRPIYIFDHIWLISSYRRNVSDKSWRGNQNTHFIMLNKVPPPAPKIVPLMR